MTNEIFRSNLLSLIKEHADGKLSRFAEILGLHSSYLDRWLNKEELPSGRYFINFYDKLGINIHWLLTGEGDKYTKEALSFVKEAEYAYGPDAELLLNYKQLSKDKKKEAVDYIKYLLSKERKSWQVKKQEHLMKDASSTYIARKKI